MLLSAIVAVTPVALLTPITELPSSSRMVLPETVRLELGRVPPSSPYEIMTGFIAPGPFSIVLFSITALPPFGRSMS